MSTDGIFSGCKCDYIIHYWRKFIHTQADSKVLLECGNTCLNLYDWHDYFSNLETRLFYWIFWLFKTFLFYYASAVITVCTDMKWPDLHAEAPVYIAVDALLSNGNYPLVGDCDHIFHAVIVQILRSNICILITCPFILISLHSLFILIYILFYKSLYSTYFQVHKI